MEQTIETKIKQKEKEKTEKGLSKELWGKVLTYLKPYRKNLILIGGCMFVLAGIDSMFPLLTKYAIDHFIEGQTLEGFTGFVILYMAAVVSLAGTVFFFISQGAIVEAGIIRTLRKYGFEKLQELSFSYYDKNAVGWMMARLTSDIQRLGDMLSWGLVDFLWGFSMMLFIVVVMVFINFKLALITLSVIPLLAVLTIFFQKRILKTSRKVRKINSKLTGAFNEGITGAKATKSLVSEDTQFDEFEKMTIDMKRTSYRSAIYSAVYLPIVLTLGSVGMALIINFGGYDIQMGALSFGTMVLFTNYAVLFYEPVREMARVYAELQTAQASAERLISLIETPLEIQDSAEVIEKYGSAFEPIRENWETFSGEIAFENVNFHYLEDEPVLYDFNFKVKAGQKIALVGETGSGKSTIVNLACRFYEPVSGKILLDGVDYRERSQLWLHDQIGYVLQSPHLFSGTIRDNIKYGKLEATEEEMIAAAKLTNAHDFIMKLDKGYDTEVGEGGAMLSTGEKQLVSFARAVIKNPRLFILDEATSSIDTETEMLIQDAIDRVLADRTSFVIAHRLSTIRSADVILVMKKGRVVEKGNHHELMSQKGYYYKLYTHQFVEEEEMHLLNKA
ncbi:MULTISPECIES: ABC transporter ATP-binding protein [unclassified Fusibacter]|uniref:ABC transporter ATP-binding protein n=1 Tax=unclassified Fusibacter TaxID=2624464 RepID=UPI001010A938|nr:MULTISPECIES: ABC transporter ATP-binding protein [unclassified Fusibacter]MCK8061396.1 ABC transporter ATP-binding protein/permease [Fusibacter sp. A2]NPE23561.1 ABC transporter ATP-binding protein [Fusibacter sp. A1]RXV58971.1 ABC transporter ATP-binding protein [Fusibacter sp. A1]